MSDDELSDEQLHQLLKDIEQRLKAARPSHSNLGQTQKPSLSSLQISIASETPGSNHTSYIKSTDQGTHVVPLHLMNPQERTLSNGIRRVVDPVTVKSNTTKAKRASAGPNWYNLPRTTLTPELKRDLQLLRMRSVLDPKRHYKKEGSRAQVPEFSQVGTIIEGPTEFFSARLSNQERKRTFVEEVLAGESSTHRFRSKYNEIQAAKTSGKKSHYKKMKAQRRGGSLKG